MGSLERRAHSVLLLLTDGLGGDQMEVVRGAYAVVGALREADTGLPRLLGSLETRETSRSVVFHGGEWFATTVAVGRDYVDVAPTSGTYAGPYEGVLTTTKRAAVTNVEYLRGQRRRRIGPVPTG